ncbi:MAG: LysR family transcriptional regulator [Clostridium sp.]|nr:LysR family transcriptional regulator [Clostridium sp.]MCM1459313.1 LysR family transcriptional regulator [Bacteroides sp.]
MYENLNNYKVFYTVAKKGTISHAAEALFISQPAISKTISNLEAGLGTKLFDRTSKGVTLTAEGEILYNHISRAFDSITQGEEEIKRINELGIGELRIGVSTSLCKFVLLDYLQDFIIANPHVKLFIDCHATVNTIKLLQEDKIDIGLICETNIPNGFHFQPIAEIHDIFVASRAYLDNLNLREQDEDTSVNNPWLIMGNYTNLMSTNPPKKQTRNALGEASPSDRFPMSTKEILEKSNLMLLEKNNITRTYIDAYLSENGIYPNQVLEINNMDLLIDFASIGMGVASVVREFATEQLHSGVIMELPLEHEIKKRAVGFIYSENKQRSAALNWFIEFCLFSNRQ